MFSLRLPLVTFTVMLLLLAVLGPGSSKPSGYQVTFLPDPPNTVFGGATAINNKGQVVLVGKDRSYLWVRGKLTDLGTLANLGMWAEDLNDKGQVVGHGWSQTPYQMRAFLWERGTLRELPALGGKNSSAWAISNRGQIVGSADTGQGKGHAVLWESGRPLDLGTLGGDRSSASDINDRGQIVGYSTMPDGATHAFLWEGDRMKDLGVLPGYTSSVATAINNKGWVIGMAYRPGRPVPGTLDSPRSEDCLFLYRDGVLMPLAALGGEHHSAFAINGSGDIVGVSFATPDGQRAFLNHEGKAVDLTRLLPRDTSGEVYWAKDLNDRGQIVGGAKIGGQRRLILLTPR